jgi:hypothetical protein
MKRLALILFMLTASACRYSPTRSDAGVHPVATDGPGGWASETPLAGPTLYARDGSPVQGPVDGRVVASKTNLSHDVEQGGSRLYLLELYQTAMDEKDELNVELNSLDQMLQRSDLYNQELEARILSMDSELADARLLIAELQQNSIELAGRLTTAEIRRLETKKQLLEHRLEWERAAAQVQSTPLSQPALGRSEQ